MATVTLNDASTTKSSSRFSIATSATGRPAIPNAWLSVPPAFWWGAEIYSDGRVAMTIDTSQSSFDAGRDDLTDAVESGLRLRFASGGRAVTVAGPTAPGTTRADASEPYTYAPANAADVVAFFNAVAGSAAASATMKYPGPPTLPNVRPQTVVQGGSFVLPAHAGGAGAVVLSVAGLAGLAIDQATRRVTVPLDAAVGPHAITYTATDEDGADWAASRQFQLTVEQRDLMPAFAAIPEQRAAINTPFSLDLSNFASGGDGALTYALANNPAWLDVDQATGIASGTPADVAPPVAVRATVTDADGDSASVQFNLAVGAWKRLGRLGGTAWHDFEGLPRGGVGSVGDYAISRNTGTVWKKILTTGNVEEWVRIYAPPVVYDTPLVFP